MYDISQIKDIRKRLNLTQSDLAKKSGVSQSLIAKIESGTLDPSYSNAQKIFSAFDMLAKRQEKTAKEMMIKKVITLKPNDSIKDAIKKMRKYDISQMPVVANNNPIGLVSEKSIISKIAELDLESTSGLKVEDVMEECPPVISPNTTYKVISSLLQHYPILLVTEKGIIKGSISKSDVLKLL